MIPIPRIQGKVGQATEPEEMKDKWFFTIWVSFLGQGDEASEFGPIGPWETEEIAQKELRRACQLICEKAEEEMVGAKSGEYIDMKTNFRRRWDRSNEN